MQFYTLYFSLLVVLTICYATAASSCKHDDLSQKSDDYGADYRCVWGKQINRYTNKNYYYYYYYYYVVVVVVVVVVVEVVVLAQCYLQLCLNSITKTRLFKLLKILLPKKKIFR